MELTSTHVNNVAPVRKLVAKSGRLCVVMTEVGRRVVFTLPALLCLLTRPRTTQLADIEHLGHESGQMEGFVMRDGITLTSYSSHCAGVRDLDRVPSSHDEAYLEVTHQLITEVRFPSGREADLDVIVVSDR